MTTGTHSERGRLTRRTYLRAAGSIAVASLISGCADTDENNGNADGDSIGEDAEPDYEGWLDDVDNYEGTIDGRGEDSVEVAVGADGGLSFGPPAVFVDPGTEVVWKWTGDGGQHDVVHVDGIFESELTDEQGHIFEYVFDEPGVYRYVCVPHEAMDMKGAVAVEGQ